MPTPINNSTPLGRRNLVTSIVLSIAIVLVLSITNLLTNAFAAILLLIIACVVSLEMTVLFYIKEGNLIIKNSLLFPKSTKVTLTDIQKLSIKNRFFSSSQDYRFELKNGSYINVLGRLSKTERKQLFTLLAAHGINVATDTTYI